MAASISGVVKSYSASRGWGFIQSEHVTDDVYFQRMDLPEELQTETDDGFLRIDGRPVSCDLHYQKDGKPRGKNVCFIVSEGEDVMGVVKSYNDQKGFGFVKTSMIDQDVYFQKKDVPNQIRNSSIVGMKVKMQLALMDDGKIQARQMMFHAMPMVPTIRAPIIKGGKGMVTPVPSMGMVTYPCKGGMAMGMYEGIPMGLMGKVGPAGKGVARFAPDGTAMRGIVKSHNAQKGWGFINVNGIAADIYFKGESQGFRVGQPICFELRWTKDGKPQAQNCSLPMTAGESICDERATIEWAANLEEQIGRVKSYNAAKGFGFVTVEGLPQDVYFQSKDLPAGLEFESLEGTLLQFVVHTTPDGKPQMRNAYLVEAPPQGLKRQAVDVSEVVKRPRQDILPLPPSAGSSPRMAIKEESGCLATVKSYNASKGFGFLTSPDIDCDVYFNRSCLPQALQMQELTGRYAVFNLKYTVDGKPQAASLTVH